MEWDPYLKLHIKINSNYMEDLNVRPETTINLLEENIRKI